MKSSGQRANQHDWELEDDEGPRHPVAPGKVSLTQRLPAPIRRKVDDGVISAGAGARVAAASGSTGSPLPRALQASWESALGVGLGDVRVHTGGPSQAAASAIGAKAYAMGSDVHFGPRQYQPGSAAGRQLIAHEVAHTVQQSAGATALMRSTEAGVAADDTAEEAQADQVAEAMAERERLLEKLPEEAKKIRDIVMAAVPMMGKLERSTAAKVISRFVEWKEKKLINELIAELGKLQVSNKLMKVLGKTTSCWMYLVRTLEESDCNRLYDVISLHNVNAKNWGRLSDELMEMWKMRMGDDVSIIKSRWASIQEDEGNVAKCKNDIVDVFMKWAVLDARYSMKGTLLSQFILKLYAVRTVDEGLITDVESCLLHDLQRGVGGIQGGMIAGVIDRSNLVLAKEGPPDDMDLGSWLKEELASAVDKVDALIGMLAHVGKEQAKKIINELCSIDPGLVVDLFVSAAEDFGELFRFALTILSGEWMVILFKKIDWARLASFMAAWVALNYIVAVSPFLLPPMLLMPKKYQRKVLRALDTHVFKTLIDTCKDFIVPWLRGFVDDCWPVGLGFALDRGVGVGVGVVFAGGEKYFHMIRNSSDTLMYRERVQMEAGVGVGKGIGKNTGGPAAKGATKEGVRAEAGVQANAGGRMIKFTESEFSIFDDNAFVSLLTTLVEIDEAVAATATISSSMNDINPLKYIKNTKIELEAFAGGSARASAGLVDGGEGTAAGVQKWDQAGGKADLGAPNFWQRHFGTFGVSVQQVVSIGGAVEMTDIGGKDGDLFEVMLSGKIGAISNLNLALPGLGGLLSALLPRVNGEAGVRIKVKVKGVKAMSPERVKGLPKVSLYAETGDFDTYAGAASETNLELQSPSLGSFKSLQDFRDSLANVTIKKRVALQGMFGGKLWGRLADQKGFTTMLPKEYSVTKPSELGAEIEAYVDAKFHLPDRAVKNVFDLLVEVAGDIGIETIKTDLWDLITDAKAPKYFKKLERVVEIMLDHLDELRIHIEGGVRGAIGGGFSGDEKSRYHGHAGALIIWEQDVKKWATPKIDEVIALMREKVGG